MNWRLVVFWAAVALIVAMCVVPPWVGHARSVYVEGLRFSVAGYAPVWKPPAGVQVYLDKARLVIQCFIVAFLASAIIAHPWLRQRLGAHNKAPPP